MTVLNSTIPTKPNLFHLSTRKMIRRKSLEELCQTVFLLFEVILDNLSLPQRSKHIRVITAFIHLVLWKNVLLV